MVTSKKIFWVITVIFIFSSTVLAQNNLNGRQHRAYKNEHNYLYWSVPVYCDGALIDQLTGTLWMEVLVTQTGKGASVNSKIYGQATSTATGEVFTVHQHDRRDWIEPGGIRLTFLNLIGNQGSHYVERITYRDSNNEILSIDKAVCPGN